MLHLVLDVRRPRTAYLLCALLTVLPEIANAAISIATVTPAAGSIAGGTYVEVVGNGFQPGATVAFGGAAATNVTVRNAGLITARAPAQAAASVGVTVTNPDLQSATAAGAFTFRQPPSIVSLDQTAGPSNGGTTVVISGTGFDGGAKVRFGETAAAGVSVTNSTTMTVVTPVHASGIVDVVVVNPDGTTGRALNRFSFEADLASATDSILGTAQGNVYLVSPATSDVSFFDGTATSLIQASGTLGSVNTIAVAGSGAAPGDSIGIWRRGTDDAWIARNGAVSHIDAVNPTDGTTPMNPEQAAASDGCAFIVYRDPATKTVVRRVYRVEPVTGTPTQITGSIVTPPPGTNTIEIGASRIATSDCQAAFVWDPDGSSTNNRLYFFTGTPPGAIVDTGVISGVTSLAHGRVVYFKEVSRIPQVFLYDSTAAAPAPVQLTSYPDNTLTLASPRTDGRHVAWLTSDGVTQTVTLDGVAVTSPGDETSGSLNVNYRFDLDGGTLLWNDAGQSMRLLAAGRIATVDPTPALSGTGTMAGGFVAFTDGTAVYRARSAAPLPGTALTAPMLVRSSRSGGQVTVRWDRVIGAASYNLYYATEPGVTKDNYGNLAGGTRFASVTSPFTIPGIANATDLSIAVTAVVDGVESPPTSEPEPGWSAVGPAATNFNAVAGNLTDGSTAYAGTTTAAYQSTDAGMTWIALPDLAGVDVRAFASAGAMACAATRIGKIYRTINNGGNWTLVADGADIGETAKSLAIDPGNPSVLYAGDFQLATWVAGTTSYVIKSSDGGVTWGHVAEFPAGEIRAYTLAVDPLHAGTLFAGGSGTPNLAKSVDGGAAWTDASPGAGYVYASAVDPRDPATILAAGTTFVPAPWGPKRSRDGGASWLASAYGLGSSLPGLTRLVADPEISSTLYTATSDGVFRSCDDGSTWTPFNDGLGAGTWVNDLALTPSRRLVAATGNGLLIRGTDPAPRLRAAVPAVAPAAGGSVVRIEGSGFLNGAEVWFGAIRGPSTFDDAKTITATAPPHAVGTVDLFVVNSDGRVLTLPNGFTFVPPAPAITSFNPASGPPGTAVTITGTNLLGATSVKFAGVAAVFTVTNATSIDATVPASAVSGTISVTTPGGTATSSASFLVLPAGDVNGDGTVTAADVVALVDFLFAGGPPPSGPADADASGAIDVADVFYLVNYLFAAGPSPV